MSNPLGRSAGRPAGPPPRTNGTPSGYKNVRVLTPDPLHFRLVAYAGLSMLSLNEFVLKWLNLATPIDPATGTPSPLGTAPGQPPALDLIEGPGSAHGPGAARSRGEPAPRQSPAHGPLDVPGEAVRPGAALSPKAPARSRPDHPATPSFPGSLPTVAPADPSSVHGPDPTNARGHARA